MKEGDQRQGIEMHTLPLIFTPSESPSIYAGDGRNKGINSFMEGRVKALPFLTGFTSGMFSGNSRRTLRLHRRAGSSISYL